MCRTQHLSTGIEAGGHQGGAALCLGSLCVEPVPWGARDGPVGTGPGQRAGRLWATHQHCSQTVTCGPCCPDTSGGIRSPDRILGEATSSTVGRDGLDGPSALLVYGASRPAPSSWEVRSRVRGHPGQRGQWMSRAEVSSSCAVVGAPRAGLDEARDSSGPTSSLSEGPWHPGASLLPRVSGGDGPGPGLLVSSRCCNRHHRPGG